MSGRTTFSAGLLLAATLLSSALLSGCGRIVDYVTIVDANRLHDRGLYQDAVAAYLSVRSPPFEPTVDYDLADVYARLGESTAASELYARARQRGDGSLRADAFFNEGVTLYERGRYEEAWRAFRSALTESFAAGGSGHARFVVDARRNLELAWRAWRKRTSVPPRTVAPAESVEGSQDEAELRLLRRLETGRWRPGLASPAPVGRDDY